jgi:hypothetical protein
VKFGDGGTGRWWWWCGGTDVAVGFLEGEIDEVNDGRDFMRLWFAKGVRCHLWWIMLSCLFSLV